MCGCKSLYHDTEAKAHRYVAFCVNAEAKAKSYVRVAEAKAHSGNSVGVRVCENHVSRYGGKGSPLCLPAEAKTHSANNLGVCVQMLIS